MDSPIEIGWCELLADQGYAVERVIPARTRRYGGLDNADKRADHEAVIVARRREERGTTLENGSGSSQEVPRKSKRLSELTEHLVVFTRLTASLRCCG